MLDPNIATLLSSDACYAVFSLSRSLPPKETMKMEISFPKTRECWENQNRMWRVGRLDVSKFWSAGSQSNEISGIFRAAGGWRMCGGSSSWAHTHWQLLWPPEGHCCVTPSKTSLKFSLSIFCLFHICVYDFFLFLLVILFRKEDCPQAMSIPEYLVTMTHMHFSEQIH